jgi:hypothetical protein
MKFNEINKRLYWQKKPKLEFLSAFNIQIGFGVSRFLRRQASVGGWQLHVWTGTCITDRYHYILLDIEPNANDYFARAELFGYWTLRMVDSYSRSSSTLAL